MVVIQKSTEWIGIRNQAKECIPHAPIYKLSQVPDFLPVWISRLTNFINIKKAVRTLIYSHLIEGYGDPISSFL